MPSNTTINSLPPGVNSLDVVNASLHGLLIEHTALVLLVPLLVALFYYSTPYTRRQPLFILNVLAVVSSLVSGTFGDILNIRMMLLQQGTARLQIAIGSICIFQSMFVDLILLVRLITVHPLSRIGFLRFALLTSLPIILKLARVTNAILYVRQLCIMANGPDGAEEVETAWVTLPYLKIEWIAQMVDNSYASILFIWTIRNIETNVSSRRLTNVASFSQSPFSARLRMLLNFALSNFIIPSVLSIVQIGVIFKYEETDPSLIYISLVNSRLSVFGVVFATVWAGKEYRREVNAANRSSNQVSRGLGEQCSRGLGTWRAATALRNSECADASAPSEKHADERDEDFIGRHRVSLHRDMRFTEPRVSCHDGRSPPGIPQDANHEISKSHGDPEDLV